jgi:hypothetical protein
LPGFQYCVKINSIPSEKDSVFAANKRISNTMKTCRILAACLAVVVCAAVSVNAQQPVGTVAGVVKDPAGGLIPGAAVSAVHIATGRRRDTTSDAEGRYLIPGLQVGTYHIDFSATGFPKRVRMENVHLKVGQTVTVNAELGASGPEVEVVVTAIDAVDTQTSKVDMVIGEREIEHLPLNGRNFLERA